jgi:hypothetical protein
VEEVLKVAMERQAKLYHETATMDSPELVKLLSSLGDTQQ